MCQGLRLFSGFLHHFVLAKLATNSIRVADFWTGKVWTRVHSKRGQGSFRLFVHYPIFTPRSSGGDTLAYCMVCL